MEVSLTADTALKIAKGEVMSHNDLIPILQVKEMKTLQRSPAQEARYIVLFHDGVHSIKGLLGKTLVGYVNEKFIQVGSIVRLLHFGTVISQEQRVVIVIQLEVIQQNSEMILHDFDELLSIESSDNMSFVPETPEGSAGSLERTFPIAVESFRVALRGLKRFIHHTRSSKDEIRATIRCINKMLDDFDKPWLGGLRITDGAVRPHSDESEESSCDQLRSVAHTLLKFLRTKILSMFVRTVNPEDTEKAILDADIDVVEEGTVLVYRVINQGFDCRDVSDDEEDVE